MTYRVCTEAGIAVRFFIGVQKDGDRLLAHSWVQRIDEKPAADHARWPIVYSHPPLAGAGPGASSWEHHDDATGRPSHIGSDRSD